ncbi:ATP-binding protein [Falsiroseomonas ponticola]|uniref:ATP-binding protein n=1 Tax=Falsiroseomonas ponticola TaxID=2786951 RepID=UPI001933BF8A|nr:ATP-binding protein [Roseomonas ponticola]
METASWLADLLVAAFEQAGSSATGHWSDRFLEHWTLIWSDLEQGMRGLPSAPEERHAWELFRLAGIPVPARERDTDNPFLRSPMERLVNDDAPRLARRWQQLVDEFVIPRGGIELLLMALDLQVPGAQKPTPWRGLGWAGALDLSPEAPAPVVGRRVFARAPSPTLLTSSPPVFPIAPVPAWWGVNIVQLESARAALHQARGIASNPSCAALTALPGREAVLVLQTRCGSVSDNASPTKWRTTVSLNAVSLRLREPWASLHVTHSLPVQGAHGATTIDPDSVKLSVSGTGVKADIRALRVVPGEQLEIEFDIAVTYSAAVDSGGASSGSWHPVRTLRIVASARDWTGTGWGEARPVDHSVEIIVPSCFSPILLAYNGIRGKLVATPDRGDTFERGPSDSMWNAGSTPDLLLAEEGSYTLVGYDGRVVGGGSFAAEAAMDVMGRAFAAVSGLQQVDARLDEGDQVEGSTAGVIAVVKVKQRARSVTSGLVAAIRNAGAGRKPPSSNARASVFGRFQGGIVGAVRNSSSGLPNSLFQFVLGSNRSSVDWPAIVSTAPTVLANLPPSFKLPGIGNGPSEALTTSAAWQRFVAASGGVLDHLGVRCGGEDIWLSATNPGELPGRAVRTLVDAHSDLVAQAKTLSAADVFWASYPFSIVVVDDAPGPNLGHVQAVFLSPLHPVRLAWAFSVARLAQSSNIDRVLLGIAEGWNLPLTGVTVSVTGQPVPLVALPLDPGEDADFAAWSALGILGNDGLMRVPRLAAGLELPWGGPSGINQKVVDQAIKDYLAIHPYLSSFEVDVRSVSPAPRATEIDDALVRAIGGAAVREISLLGGATRIWDSENRLGTPPSRDQLRMQRDSDWRDRPFEWRRYAADSAPPSSDIALIENASAHMGVVDAIATGVLAPLPLRRFSVSAISGQVLDQQYAGHPGDDVLGLSRLLAGIEYSLPNGASALRVAPQANALGIGRNARWEVLGTLNVDPALLSSTIRAGGHADRMLWEWRPSWLADAPGDRDALAKRAHYVVARVPASLIKGLASRQGLPEAAAQEMIAELGRRGIGLASLQAAGGTQESATAGHFYATRILLPPAGHAQPQGWVTLNSNTFAGLLPIDPVAPILLGIAGESPRRRADLLVFKVSLEADAVRIGIVPVEVKHHGQPQAPTPLPADNDPELRRAREQLRDAAGLVGALARAVNPAPGVAQDPVAAVVRRQACAMLLDLALSFTDEPVNARARATILRHVVQGRVAVDAGPAMLLWFAPGSITTSGSACIVREDESGSYEAFIDPAAVPGTCWPGREIGPDDAELRRAIDEAMRAMFVERVNIPPATETDVTAALSAMLGLMPDPTDELTPPAAVANEGGAPSHASPVNDGASAISASGEQSSPAVSGGPPGAGGDAAQDTPPSVAPSARLAPPAAYVGWAEPATRFCLLGNMVGTNEQVAVDLDNPKAIGVFGYMGSGKSYLLGTLVESALVPIPGINSLPAPLAVVVFNYRRHSADRFELGSFAHPNPNQSDRERLEQMYNASPRSVDDIHILCLPGQLTPERIAEYGGLPASELYFDPSTLGVEDWELLMGEPGSNAVFARAIRNTLMDLQAAGDVSLQSLERSIANTLNRSSQAAAQLRLDFIRRYLSDTGGLQFSEILRPGRAVIFDLRQPLFNKDDALRFFLVCSNHISRVQGDFNKLVVFDEAHEYMSEAFGEKIEARIRLMRHEGTSYVFATQDVGSIPLQIRRFITTRFVFSLGTRDNINDLIRFAPEFADLPLQQIAPGTCYVQSIPSQRNLFARPRLVQVRPRVTQHGGTSRIFTGDDTG